MLNSASKSISVSYSNGRCGYYHNVILDTVTRAACHDGVSVQEKLKINII